MTNPWMLGVLVAGLALLDSVPYLQTAGYRLTLVPDQL
jgi:hypothetical protein